MKSQVEGKGHRGKGGGGLYILNGGSGGPQPQTGYSEEKLRGRTFLKGPGSVAKFLEFISGHSKLIGEKYYSEMRSGVKIERKSRVNFDDLRDSFQSGTAVDDDVEIRGGVEVDREMEKLKKKGIAGLMGYQTIDTYGRNRGSCWSHL